MYTLLLENFLIQVSCKKGIQLKAYVRTIEVILPLTNVVNFVILEAFGESLRLLTPLSRMVWLRG